MVLNPDFTEFLRSLNNSQVHYLVTEGYPVALHGYLHYTKDLDIWNELSRDNAQKLVAAIDDFGSASLGLNEEDFLEPGTVVHLGYPPNRIDRLATVTGVDFQTCYRSRIVIRVDDVDVNFIDLNSPRKISKLLVDLGISPILII